MLNELCFQVLADRAAVPDQALRFFLQLMRDYDLSKYRQMSLRLLARRYKLTQREVRLFLATLTESVLEATGPMGATGRLPVRIAPQYLLRGSDLENWLAEVKALDERRTLVRKAGVR